MEMFDSKKPVTINSALKLGESVDVSKSFHSQSKPTTLIWIAGEKKIYYGAKTSKYISREISALGDDLWSATLHIMNLSNEDIGMNFTLQIKSNSASENYHFKISGMHNCLSRWHN